MTLILGKHVEDVMTTDVSTVTATTSFTDIASTIVEKTVSGFPVVDDNGHVIGVVSEADLLLKEEYDDPQSVPLFKGKRHRVDRAKAAGRTARDLMTSPAVTVQVGTAVGVAARLMHQKDVKRLPVLDVSGKLVGIVSRSDLLKVFLPSDEDIRTAVEELLNVLWIHLQGVDVSVDRGVVTLSGQIASLADSELLANLAGQLDGVKSVVNRLHVPINQIHKG